MEFFHHPLPDLRALDLSFPSFLKMELDAIDDFLDQVNTDRPLLTGFFQAIENLKSIKNFSPPVFLHHQRKGILCPLAGGESLMAAETLPPSPDGILILSQTGIHHFTLRMITKRTFHLLNVVSGMWKVDLYIDSLPSTFYPPFPFEFFNFNS